MCTQKPPHDFSQQLYERYREAFNAYIISDVLPALRGSASAKPKASATP